MVLGVNSSSIHVKTKDQGQVPLEGLVWSPHGATSLGGSLVWMDELPSDQAVTLTVMPGVGGGVEDLASGEGWLSQDVLPVVDLTREKVT